MRSYLKKLGDWLHSNDADFRLNQQNRQLIEYLRSVQYLKELILFRDDCININTVTNQNFMDVSTEEIQRVINLIKEEAQAIWGKKWFSQIVHKYCAIEGRETGKQPNYLGRRHQLSRILHKGEGGTMTTLFRLAECVDLEVSLSKPLASSRQKTISANRASSPPSLQSA